MCFFLCLGLAARATTLPRVLALDIGAGVPVVAAGEISVLFAEHWQVGFGYGYVPGLSALSNVKVPDQTVTLNGIPDSLTFSPKFNASIDMLTPFLRFFPTERNFYFQVAYSVLRMNMTVSGPLKDSATGTEIGGALSGTVGVTQPVPTLSLGHIFASREFFVNISLGVSFLLSPSVNVALGGTIPDALGGSSGNQDAINKAQSQLADSIQHSVDTARQQITLIPSVLISCGVFL